jgi:hypothetical protein
MVDKLILPARTETKVRLPESEDSRIKEGLVERSEIITGVHLAESLVKVNNLDIISSIVNTRGQEAEIP